MRSNREKRLAWDWGIEAVSYSLIPPGLMGPGSIGWIGLVSIGAIGARSIGVMVMGDITEGSGDIGGRIDSIDETVVMVAIGEIGVITVIGETTVIGEIGWIGEIGGNGEIPTSPPKTFELCQ